MTISSGAISDTYRHIAGNENDRAVFTDRAGERQREAGQQRRHQARQDHAGNGLPAAGAKLAAASSISAIQLVSTGWTVRTTNGRPMNIIATMMPSGV